MRRALQWEVIRTLNVSGPSQDPRGRLHRFRPDEWLDCLPWLRRSGLELLFWDHLQSSGHEQALPPRVRTCIERDASHNRQRLAAMEAEFLSLILLFHNLHLPHAVLKGFALVPDYCSSPELRNQYDFDFLIRADDLPSVGGALRDAGFVPKGGNVANQPTIYHHAHRKPRLPATLDGIFSQDLHRPLELHTRLWDSRAESIGLQWSGDPLHRSRPQTLGGVCFPALAPEDALLFQVLHTFHHLLNNWCRLSLFHEIAVFLKRRSKDEPFWQAFRNLVQGQDRLCKCTGVIFLLAVRLFGARIPDAAKLLSIEALTPAMALWVERYGVRSAIQNFSEDKFSLFLHRMFISDGATWAEVRTRRLFPLHRPHMTVSLEGTRGWRRWAALGKQAAHSCRRLFFHIKAGICYLLEIPFWSMRTRTLPVQGGLRSPQNIPPWTAPAGIVGGVED